MRTIQMTLDDDLVATVDLVVKQLHTTRSAFTRQALREAIKQAKTIELEKKHKAGYTRHPVGDSEFSDWETEQEWGDR